MKTHDQIKSVSDDSGNLLVCKDNGKRVILTLKLAGTTRHRKLGTINRERKVIEIKRSRFKHLFKKNRSYGFNHKLLADAKLFKDVRLVDEHDEWLIPKEFILTNGSFLHFKNNGGFERQIFIPLDMIEQFKREPKF